MEDILQHIEYSTWPEILSKSSAEELYYLCQSLIGEASPNKDTVLFIDYIIQRIDLHKLFFVNQFVSKIRKILNKFNKSDAMFHLIHLFYTISIYKIGKPHTLASTVQQLKDVYCLNSGYDKEKVLMNFKEAFNKKDLMSTAKMMYEFCNERIEMELMLMNSLDDKNIYKKALQDFIVTMEIWYKISNNIHCVVLIVLASLHPRELIWKDYFTISKHNLNRFYYQEYVDKSGFKNAMCYKSQTKDHVIPLKKMNTKNKLELIETPMVEYIEYKVNKV